MSILPSKSASAFRTIGEVAANLGVPQHILRYWETRFPQLRPLQRAGKRRYSRPEDVALVERIHNLLNKQGYTVKGVQKLLSSQGVAASREEPAPHMDREQPAGAVPISALVAIRDRLAKALAADEIGSRL